MEMKAGRSERLNDRVMHVYNKRTPSSPAQCIGAMPCTKICAKQIYKYTYHQTKKKRMIKKKRVLTRGTGFRFLGNGGELVENLLQDRASDGFAIIDQYMDEGQ